MRQSQSQQYQKQIESIMFEIGMDFGVSTSISNLIEIREKLVRGHVIMTHTYLDYLITEKINRYYFKMGKTNLLTKIQKDCKIKVFNHQIMEGLSFIKKLEVLKELSIITKSEYNTIEKMNSLRNNIAHIFNFDVSKKTSKHGTIKYKDNDIFDVAGIQLYNFDYSNILTILSS